MTGRQPGEGRYAHVEREQRWLVDELPPDLMDECVIVDHYWTGSRLRLRMIQCGDETVYKLCQKVRPDPQDPGLVKITNFYLSESEFRALSVTPASIVTKSRWTLLSGGVRYAVDEFKGRHAGLVLAEVELTVDQSPVHGPVFALKEVTDVNEYSGGWLATASAADLRRIIP